MATMILGTDFPGQEMAACKGSSADFFPSTPGQRPSLAGIATEHWEALQLCDSCPVAKECFEYYLSIQHEIRHATIAGGHLFLPGRGNHRLPRPWDPKPVSKKYQRKGS